MPSPNSAYRPSFSTRSEAPSSPSTRRSRRWSRRRYATLSQVRWRTGFWASALRDTRDAIVSGTAPGNVVVDLRPLIEEVKRRLVADGLQVAAQVRPPSTRVVVVPDTTVSTAREWYGAIRTFAVGMPIVAGVALLLALAVATRRTPVLLGFAAGSAAAMGALAYALAQARQPYLEQLRADERTVVAAVYDAFAGSLRHEVWWVFGIALGLTLVLLTVLAARRRSADAA